MSVRAGGIDWIERWRQMQEAAEAASAGHEPAHGEDRWQRRAARFDRVSRGRRDESLELIAAGVLPSDVVADLGAGVGRHAVPISRRCARVIAIEPSAAMRARMQARVEEEGASNVEIVAAAWPCSLPLVDVSFSVHVLYAVPDAAGFVEAMTRVTRRSCVLALGLRAPADGLAGLWQELHGRARPPRPAALEALALLHQLGHRASLRVVPSSERLLEFSPNDEDLNDLCHRLGVEADEPGRSRVRVALDRLYPREAAGAWVLGASGPNAILEWPGSAAAP